MKKSNVSVSNPDELNKHLQHTSPATWIILSMVIAILIGFFAWSFIHKIKLKLSGTATVSGGVATLHIEDKDSNKLQVGQSVYISNLEGKILSFQSDKQPIVSNFELPDNDYPYYVVYKECRPIDFLLGK